MNREAPFTRTRYLDEDIEVDFSLHKEPGQKGNVVASHPLTNESWTRFEGGELIVFKNGEKVYSSTSSISPNLEMRRFDEHVIEYIRKRTSRVSIKKISEDLQFGISSVKRSIKILKEIS